MEEDQVRQWFEQVDPEGKIPQDRIEDFITIMKERETNPLKDGDRVGDAEFHILKEQLETETDWRKKASIAAKIISLGLE